MKHIEQNFRKIMGCQFLEKELEILKSFLSELKSFPAVECIFLVPTYKEIEYGRETFDYFYKDFSVILNKKLMTNEDYNQIQRCMIETNVLLENQGYFFVNEYEFKTIEEFDEFYWKSLVSSYIIFDRNGTYEKLQDEIKTQVEPRKPISEYSQVGALAEIENIDKLSDKTLKKKVLQKNNN